MWAGGGGPGGAAVAVGEPLQESWWSTFFQDWPAFHIFFFYVVPTYLIVSLPPSFLNLVFFFSFLTLNPCRSLTTRPLSSFPDSKFSVTISLSWFRSLIWFQSFASIPLFLLFCFVFLQAICLFFLVYWVSINTTLLEFIAWGMIADRKGSDLWSCPLGPCLWGWTWTPLFAHHKFHQPPPHTTTQPKLNYNIFHRNDLSFFLSYFSDKKKT